MIDVEALYSKYGPMVLRRCRQLLKNEESALDAMQDTFVKVLRYKNRLSDSAPSSLLYRIATNICLNKIRSRQSKKETGIDEILFTIASAEDVEMRIWIKDLIELIFRQVRASTKEIAVLYYIDGLTLKQVADEVGLSVSGVRKRLRKLREKAYTLKEVV